MSTRPAVRSSVALAGLICATALRADVQPQQFVDVARIELRPVKVADSLYYIEGAADHDAMIGDGKGHLSSDLFSGANSSVLLGPDGVLMVDAKYAPLGMKVEQLLVQLGAKRGPPRFLIDTHIHNDHLGGNAAYGDGRTTIIAQADVLQGLHEGRQQRVLARNAWPTLTYDGSMSLHVNGEEIRIRSFPGGHTAGDSVVFFMRAGVVQMGDLYFNGFLPIVDTANGGDFLRYREIVRALYGELPDDVKIIPGHGPLATKKDFGNYLRMMDETGNLVISKMKQGRSLEEIEAEGLQPEWAAWAWANVSPAGLIASIWRSASAAGLGAARKDQSTSQGAGLEIQVTRLADSIYLLQGSRDSEALAGGPNGEWLADLFTGANTGLYVGNDGVLFVDPKYPVVRDKVIAVLRSVGAKSDAPRFVVNTHIHKDHTDGNRAFDSRTTIISHAGLRNALAAGRAESVLPQAAWPVLTYDRSLALHLDGRDIRVVNYPDGHTDGDSVVYYGGSNVVQMGDLFFNGYLPKADLENGGNFFRYRDIVKAIYRDLPDDVKIIPGHGPLASKADLRKFVRLLDETGDMVLAKIGQGKSLEQIQKEGLPEEWRSWRWSLNTPEHYLEIIYDSAKRRP